MKKRPKKPQPVMAWAREARSLLRQAEAFVCWGGNRRLEDEIHVFLKRRITVVAPKRRRAKK